MPRTFVDQPTQIFHSDDYNDQFASGVQLVSSSTSLEDDLNALRTQVRQVLWAADAGNWYDGVQGVANVKPARGLNTINSALATVEAQRFLYDIQSMAYVVVPSGSNWVGLTVSGSTAPSGLAAVGLGTTTGSFTGSIVATLAGPAWTAHSFNLVSGTSPINPRNLMVVRDAYTHKAFLDPVYDDHEVYGLLQIDSGALDGQAFADTNPGRTQISFVVEYPSGTYVAASTASIGGKIINYTYRQRTTYLGLPEDAYSHTVFVDVTPMVSGFANLSDITLQRAIDNQGNTTVTSTYDTLINLAGGGSWTLSDGNKTLLGVDQSGGGSVSVSGSSFNVDALVNNFSKGMSVATGTLNPLSLFVTPGIISSTGQMVLQAGTNLRVQASAGVLQFQDQYGILIGSGTINFANAQSEWNNFYDLFGNVSILKALDNLSSSLSSSYVTRNRASAGVTPVGGVAANVNVTYPTNLDAPLLNYVGRDFVKDMNIYLNGVLCFPALDTSGDVYPGTSPTSGDLKFPMKVRSGSVISMEIFGH
jgi:hypothetical protein